MTEYRKTEIAKILGEPSRKIQFWVDQGLVVPAISPPSGRGRAMIFSDSNLIEFEMIRVLQKQCKLNLSTIQMFLNSIREKEKDFYTSAEWGHIREIVYCFGEGIKSGHEVYFRVVKGKDGTFVLQSDPKTKFTKYLEKLMNKNFYFDTVMLGKIKMMAMKNLGLLK